MKTRYSTAKLGKKSFFRIFFFLPTSVYLFFTVVLSSQVVAVSGGKSYYDILGISKGSSPTDIKKAYRKLALKHHPDKGGDEEKFKEISKAFECLSDPEKRKFYDAYGEAGFSQGGPNAGSFPFGGAEGGVPFGAGGGQFGGPGMSGSAGGPFQSFFFDLARRSSSGGQAMDGDLDLSALLQKMMGRDAGAFSGSSFRPHSPRPAHTFSRHVTCTLEDLALGTTKKLKVTFRGQEKTYQIKLRPGWKEGTKITFSGKSGGHPTMVFIIRQAPHKFLRREGDDLHFTCWISKQQTEGGFTINVPLPTGEAWSKTIHRGNGGPVVSDGESIVVPSKGMPMKEGSGRGNLIVKFRIRQSTGQEP